MFLNYFPREKYSYFLSPDFSIGYPVVTLGFGFKSYVGYRMRMRRQKEVQRENDYYYDFLRMALPPGHLREEAFNAKPSPKPCKSQCRDYTTTVLECDEMVEFERQNI